MMQSFSTETISASAAPLATAYADDGLKRTATAAALPISAMVTEVRFGFNLFD
jgi:hypothetical protein